MLKLKRISAKIALGYLAITIITALLLGGAFYFLLRAHFINSSRLNLKERGEFVAGLLAQVPVEKWQSENILAKQQENALQRPGDIEYILLNQDRVVVDSSLKVLFPPGKPLDRSTLDLRLAKKFLQGQAVTVRNREFVVVGTPVAGEAGSRGMLILLTRLSTLDIATRELFLLLLRVLLVSAAASVLLGLLLARCITRPLKLLQERASRIARREFQDDLVLKSGDELEDLADSINRMANDLGAHDLAQKRFLQNASHELKTPLMSIQGYAEGIRDGVLEGEETDRGLEVIIKESKRLKEIVDEILYLSKLESYQETLTLQKVNIRDVLTEAAETVKALAVEKDICIEMDQVGELFVEADREKLFRVFLNILSNCVRYASKKVWAKSEKAPGDRLKLVFQDDGGGFAQQDLERLFDRFYKGTRGKTGLGMAIVKNIVDGHGWHISAANGPAGGAMITIELY